MRSPALFFGKVLFVKVLCIGDVVGTAGIAHLERVLPAVKRENGVDVCIVNGENAADGNGTTPTAADRIFAAGADVITGGNHTFRRPEYADWLDTHDTALRPANFPGDVPGGGITVVDRGRYAVTVINLLGQLYMDAVDNPFFVLDRLLESRPWIFMRRQRRRKRHSAFMPTDAFPPCSGHTRMCKPQMNRSCRRVRASSPMSA